MDDRTILIFEINEMMYEERSIKTDVMDSEIIL